MPEAGLSSRSAAESWPRLYFCHVPKTGGTSLGAWLRSVYPPRLVMPVMLPAGLADLDQEQLQGYRCFTGHFGTALPRLLDDPVPTVTLVREPIESSLSLLRFILRRDKQPLVGAVQHARIQAVIRHGDDLEASLDDDLVRALLWNRQSRFLGEAIDLRPFVPGSVEKMLEYIDTIETRPRLPEAELEALARAQLDEMAVVGVFERFTETADLIMRRFGLPTPREWPRENVAPERAADLGGRRWRDLGVSERALEQLHALTAVDRAIHAHAQQRFARQLAEEARAREAQAAERRAVLRSAARWDGVAARERLRLLRAALRLGDWWEYKVPPLLALSVLAFREQGVALSAQPAFFGGLLLALAGLGVFAHLLNDWADRDTDLRAGKPNRGMWLPAWVRGGGVLAALCVLGAGIAIAGAGPASFLLGAGSVATFLAYSVPPLRLKARGPAGAIADAVAVNTLPGLLVLDLAGRAAGGPLPWLFTAAAVVWLSAWGLRGIAWHQLRDRDRDRVSELDTAAVRLGARSLRLVTERAVFPVELAAFLALLALAGEPLAWAALALHATLAFGRSRLQGVSVSIAKPRARHSMALQELYEVLLPPALLLAQSLRVHADALALACYALLFPRRLLGFAGDSLRLARKLVDRGRKALHSAR